MSDSMGRGVTRGARARASRRDTENAASFLSAEACGSRRAGTRCTERPSQHWYASRFSTAGPMIVRRAFAVLGLIAAAFAPLGAQRIEGRLLASEKESPIRGAQVSLLRGDSIVATTRSDDEGYFKLLAPSAGIYRLTARRVGFSPGVTDPFGIRDEQLLEPVFRMNSSSVTLRPITITADGLPSAEWTLGYLDRRRHGMGHHMTREDIEKRSATNTTELLRDMPGMRSMKLNVGTDILVSTRGPSGSTGRSGCSIAAFVDGLEVGIDMLNDRVLPSEIEAIEVYPGMAQMPIQFQRLKGACGTVVVWSKAVVYRR